MPLVHRLLITLRTLMEDEPEPPKINIRRRPNGGNKNKNRNKQTTALVLTFRDLFRSGGLNIILDEIEVNRHPNRKHSPNSPHVSRNEISTDTALCMTNQPQHVSELKIAPSDQNVAIVSPIVLRYQDEAVPLLQEDTISVICSTDLVPNPFPFQPSGLFGNFFLFRRKQNKPKDLTVPLNPDDEKKTVETLKRVLKWSPRKQNSATFAVALPTEEKHTALAVVENAVNLVKEEQLRKKKRKFFWLKLC